MYKKLLKKLSGNYNKKQLDKLRPIVEKVNEIDEKRKSLNDKEVKNKTDEFKERLENGESLDELLPEAFAAVKQACRRMLGKDIERKGEKIKWDMVPYDVQVLGGIVLHKGRIAEMKTGEGKTLAATMPAYLNALRGKGVHIVTVNDFLTERDADWMSYVYNWLGLTVGRVSQNTPVSKRKEEYSKDITYVENNQLGFDFLRDNLAKSVDDRKLIWRDLNFAIIDEIDSILIDEARTPLIISNPSDVPTEKYSYYQKIVKNLKACSGKKKVSKGFLHELLNETDDEQDDQVDGDYYVDEKVKTATLTSQGIAKLEDLLGVENLYKDLGYEEIHHIENALKARSVYKKDKDYLVKNNKVMLVDENTGRVMPGRRFSQGLHQALEAKEGVKIKKESKTMASITYQNFFKRYNKLSGMTGTAATEGEEFEEIYDLEVNIIPTNEPVIRPDKDDRVYFNQTAKRNAVVDQIKFAHSIKQPILIGTSSIETSEHVSKLLNKINISHYVLNAKNHEQESKIVSNAGKSGSVVVATNMAGRGTDIKLEKNLNNKITDNFINWTDNILKGDKYLDEKSKGIKINIYSKIEYNKFIDHFSEKYDIKQNQINKAKNGYVQVDNLFEFQIDFNDKKKTKEDIYASIDMNSLKNQDSNKKISKEFHLGLFVLGTEKHESRRIDNQLRGRAGRQGDPGVSQFIVALDDTIMRKMGGDKIKSMASIMLDKKDLESMELTQKQFTSSITRSQKQIEGWHFSNRKRLFDYDKVTDKQRTRIYEKRDEILFSDYEGDTTNTAKIKEYKKFDVYEEIKGFIKDTVDDIITINTQSTNRNIKEIVEELKAMSSMEFQEKEIKKFNSKENLKDYINIKLKKHFDKKFKDIDDKDKINKSLKSIYLQIIDKNWVNHIDDMQYLRDKVGLHSYAQQDPLVIYKQQAYKKFKRLLSRLKKETLAKIFQTDFSFLKEDQNGSRINITSNSSQLMDKLKKSSKKAKNIKNKNQNHSKKQNSSKKQSKNNDIEVFEVDDKTNSSNKKDDIESDPKIVIKKGRNGKQRPNDKCNCGSGKKYKDCCGKEE